MKVTRKGTRIVRTNPLKIDIIPYLSPEYLIIIGSVESMEVAPPDEIKEIFPEILTIIGAINRVIISLSKLDIRAIVPK